MRTQAQLLMAPSGGIFDDRGPSLSRFGKGTSGAKWRPCRSGGRPSIAGNNFPAKCRPLKSHHPSTLTSGRNAACALFARGMRKSLPRPSALSERHVRIVRPSRRLSSILVHKPPSLTKAIRNSGGDEESDPQRRCRRANQEQSFARELVVLATTDKKEGQAKCGQRDAKLDAVEDATQGIFEIECQGFEILAACIAFEEGDEILAAGESIQKFRVQLGDLLTPRAAALVYNDDPNRPAKNRGDCGRRMMVIRLYYCPFRLYFLGDAGFG